MNQPPPPHNFPGPQPGYPSYPGYAAPPPPPKRSPAVPIVLGCLGVLVLLVVLGIAGIALAWKPFVAFGIASELTEYQEVVRQSELPEAKKTQLVQRIESIRDRNRQKPMSFVRWVEYSDVLDNLLDDGELADDEVPALERELGRVESEFK